MGILVEVVDAIRVQLGGTTLDAVDFVALLEQELSEVGSVLAGDACDECFFGRHEGENTPKAGPRALSLRVLGFSPAWRSVPPMPMSSSCLPSSTTLPFFHHANAVGVFDGAQAVGDDHRTASFHQGVERGLDLAL